MTNQPTLPGIDFRFGAAYYNLDDSYKVTIVEYLLVDGRPKYTGREWIKDTREKPVGEWFKELELAAAPF